MTHRNIIALVFGAGLFATGCSGSPGDTADSALSSHFLDPLQSADVNYAIENTCHLERDSETEPWHLEVRVRIDGDRDRVAQLFEAEDIVLRRDRDPMIVQQEEGDPVGGWNGVLEARGDRASTLGLTYNNVSIESAADAGGWAEVCRLAAE